MSEKMSDISKLIQEQESLLTLPEKVSRNVQLACALEPLPDKPGCTTRYRDLKPTKTLGMFVAGGVNIGPAFSHLTSYLMENKSPEGIYRFLTEAILLSKTLRQGGKINQGMLEFLIPLVTAHVLYDAESKSDAGQLFSSASDLLKKTSKEDASELIKAKEYGNMISKVEYKYPVSKHDVQNVFDYYAKELAIERQKEHTTGIVHNAQFTEGFLDIKLAYEIFQNSDQIKFSDRVIEAYNGLFKGHSDLGIGLAADFIAAALYVAFAYSQGKEVIN